MERYLANIVDKIAVANFRNANGSHWNEIMQYLEQEIRGIGHVLKIQSWQNPEGRIFKNLIVQIQGQSDETYILGAHYDSFEDTPGADDNASAVAVLLGVLKSLPPEIKPQYTWEFVFYACEEPPYFGTPDMGSYIHASSVNANQIKCMICLEMVGFYSDEPTSQEYPFSLLKWIYGDRGNFLLGVSNYQSRKEARKIMNALQGLDNSFYRKLFLPIPISGLDWSDHRSYWQKNMPALMLTDTAMFRNKNYHTPTDLPLTLNYNKMSKLTSNLVQLIQMVI
jgi:hypothetical protein